MRRSQGWESPTKTICNDFINWANNLTRKAEVRSAQEEKTREEAPWPAAHGLRFASPQAVLIAVFSSGV